MYDKTNIDEFQYELEPWDDEVTGKELYDEIYTAIESFVELEPEQINAIAIWVLHTYFIRPAELPQPFQFSPLLFITSPVRACGKSTLLRIVNNLSHNGKIATNISDASLFRLVALKQPTLFLDEIDTYFQKRSEIVGLLNSGFEVTGTVLRQTGGDFSKTSEFSTWGAKCIAGIGTQPDTLESRTLKIQLKRKTVGNNLQRVPDVLAKNPNYFIDIKRRCIRFAIDNENKLLESDTFFIDEIGDRENDCWSGLLRLAGLIKEIDNIKKSAKYLSENSYEEDDEATEFLLDVRDFISALNDDRFATEKLLSYLNGLNDKPYKYIRKDGMNGYDLSIKLKPYGIRSKQLKLNCRNIKGYEISKFEDIFKRYLSLDDDFKKSVN